MRHRGLLALLVALAAVVVAPARPAVAAELGFDLWGVPDAASGYFYGEAIGDATGGTAPYSLTATGLPAGIDLQANVPSTGNARLVGTPTNAGTYPFQLTVSDSAGASVLVDATLYVTPGEVTLRTNHTHLNGTVCSSLHPPPSFLAEHGALPYSWTLGALPRGVFFRDHNGGTDYTTVVRLVGAPKVAGTFPVTMTVESSEGTSDTLTKDLVVAPAPVVYAHHDQDNDGVPGLSVVAREGREFKAIKLRAFCGDGTTFEWRALDPLPRGMKLGDGGTLSGTPKDPGTTTFTAEVTSAGDTDTMEVTVEVARARLHFVTGERLPRARVGERYRTRIFADGGFPEYEWRRVRGTVPPGMSLSTKGGGLLLSGRPTDAGTSEFKLKVTDSHGTVRRQWFSIRVLR